MKLKKSLLILTVSMLLASCNGGMPDTNIETTAANIDHFSLLDYEENVSLANIQKDDVPVRFIAENDYLPYINMDGFNGIIKSELNNGYTSEIEHTYYTINWTVKKEGNDNAYIFISQINLVNQSIIVAGSLSEALKSHGLDYSKSSLVLDAKNEVAATKIEATSAKVYNYKNMGFRTFTYGNRHYFPLSLLNLAYSSELGFSLIYNYKALYSFSEYDYFTDGVLVDGNGNTLSPLSQMKEVVDSTIVTMPEYLINDRLSSIYFLFDNLYGLKETRNVESYMSGIDDYKEKLTSVDAEERAKGLADFIANLGDGHTTIRLAKSPYASENYSYRNEYWTSLFAQRNANITARDELYTSLGKELGDVLYSSDESMAYITQNAFSFVNEAFEEDGETRKDLSGDSFYKLLAALKEIDARDDDKVKDIVIDLTTNGGGTVGVLLKILALISKDNAAELAMKKDGYVLNYTASVDSNLDGVCDLDDVYGDDYNIYILTSNFSYSCANAMPFCAQYNGDNVIIGQKSGGGECAVATHVLPSGELVYHSGLIHLGAFDKVNNIFKGDEGGAPVEEKYAISDANFYNLDYIDSILN